MSTREENTMKPEPEAGTREQFEHSHPNSDDRMNACEACWERVNPHAGYAYRAGFRAGAEAQRELIDRRYIFELHERITAGLFPPYSNKDERFLALALAGEVGELCNMVKKRWRDGAELTAEIRDELADIRVYLELIAKCFGIEGDKLDAQVENKLQRVAKKFEHRSAPIEGEPERKEAK